MIVTLALLHTPLAVPELQRLIAHASVVRDESFRERYVRDTGTKYSTRENIQRGALRKRTPAPAGGGL